MKKLLFLSLIMFNLNIVATSADLSINQVPTKQSQKVDTNQKNGFFEAH